MNSRDLILSVLPEKIVKILSISLKLLRRTWGTIFFLPRYGGCLGTRTRKEVELAPYTAQHLRPSVFQKPNMYISRSVAWAGPICGYCGDSTPVVGRQRRDVRYTGRLTLSTEEDSARAQGFRRA